MRFSEVRSNDFPAYPAYKNSGVPWLEDVPAHWQVLPGRACYAEKAFEKDMVGVMKDDAQLFKLYSHSESFRRSLTDGVFALLDDRAR